MRSFLSFFLACMGSLTLFSKTATTGLSVGEACPSIVANTSDNSIQSFVFPNSGKITMLHFWSSANPESIKDFYRYSLIYNKFASEEYKTGNGFDMILIALQSDKKAWMADVTRYNLSDAKNGICLKGLDDFYVKNFKLSTMPTTLLVDEQGKIIAVNPDVNTTIRILNDKRDYAGDDKPVTKVSGQILMKNSMISALTNEKIYVINDRKDTVQTTQTNGNGKFTISNNNLEGMTLNIHRSEKIDPAADVLLANEKGKVVAGFTKGVHEFEYRLLDLELSFLKPVAEPEVKMKSLSKELYFSEHLYENGGYALSQKSKTKLDALLVKLKSYPGATVEIISHSDCRGSSASNQTLSLKRSESVAHYFMSKGITNDHIKAIGKGEDEPLNYCVDGVSCTEKELAQNRRTEFRFYTSE